MDSLFRPRSPDLGSRAVSIFRAEIGIACTGAAKLLNDAYQVYFRVVCLCQRKSFDTGQEEVTQR